MKKPGKMLREVLRSAVRKPATVLYPYVKVHMPAQFRGRLRFYAERCIGCRLCMKDCPTDAIVIRTVAPKKFEADIDLGRCISCGQCVDSCPKMALEMTEEFELAQLDRGKLKTTQGAPPTETHAQAPQPSKPGPEAANKSSGS
ncbi:MAG: 4Fe-4S binding protein [Phycisphaerae bacterium]|jgi:formate hydrogenlyase subunit 6/NADH:ubiquinone oxidoreductase subunit I